MHASQEFRSQEMGKGFQKEQSARLEKYWEIDPQGHVISTFLPAELETALGLADRREMY